ncbi:MAG: transporter substrate-binding domain-containing protein [Alphaproteobacteria bacterium]|nr:transporter substrate-binding domain-containing protein [Alphaproteobacteria bacterium]
MPSGLLARGRNLLFGLLCAALPAVASAESDASKTLTLATAASSPLADEAGEGFFQLISAEMFKRVGKTAKVVVVPAERAITNANLGIDDGVIPRIKGMEKMYPDLRMVPEPFMTFDFTAFTRNPDISVASWDDLKPYDLGIVTGWKILEVKTADAPSVTKVTTLEQLFGLLQRDRAQVVLAERWMAAHQATALKMDDVRALEPPLASMPMFIYVHKTHEALIEPLAEALRVMKADGTYDAIRARAGMGPS